METVTSPCNKALAVSPAWKQSASAHSRTYLPFWHCWKIGTGSILVKELVVGWTVYFTALSVIYVIYRPGVLLPLLGDNSAKPILLIGKISRSVILNNSSSISKFITIVVKKLDLAL